MHDVQKARGTAVNRAKIRESAEGLSPLPVYNPSTPIDGSRQDDSMPTEIVGIAIMDSGRNTY